MSIVTVDQVKSLGRITTASHDVILQTIIDAAESFIEEYCDISLTSAEVEESLDGNAICLYPSRKPVEAVTSVVDTEDTTATFDYGFKAFGIYKLDEEYWEEGLQRYTVTYDGGYTTPPPALVLAIMTMVLRSYKNFEARESTGEAGVSVNWQSLWSKNDVLALIEPFSHKSVLS